MPRNFVVNRRSLLLGTSALSLTGFLAACGGGNGGNTTSAESASALGVGEDIAKLVSINPKKREELKEGGEVKIPLAEIGPESGYTLFKDIDRGLIVVWGSWSGTWWSRVE